MMLVLCGEALRLVVVVVCDGHGARATSEAPSQLAQPGLSAKREAPNLLLEHFGTPR